MNKPLAALATLGALTLALTACGTTAAAPAPTDAKTSTVSGVGCADDSTSTSTKPVELTDALGRTVKLDKPAAKVAVLEWQQIEDVLSLCLTGFPGFDAPGDTRRSVIYLGPGSLRAPGDDRPSLFTDQQVIDMARRGDIQIDAVATPGRRTDDLAAISRSSGGTFVRFDSATLDSELDAVSAGARGVADQRRDAPTVVLVAGLALAGLLGVSLMAVRR